MSIALAKLRKVLGASILVRVRGRMVATEHAMALLLKFARSCCEPARTTGLSRVVRAFIRTKVSLTDRNFNRM